MDLFAKSARTTRRAIRAVQHRQKTLRAILVIALVAMSLTVVNSGLFPKAAFAAVAPGTLDTTFKTNVGTTFSGNRTRAIVIEPDGQIDVVGDFTGKFRRVNSDGTIDTAFSAANSSFVTSFVGNPYSIALQSDGSILVGDDWNGPVERATSTGSADSSFSTTARTGAGTSGTAYAIAEQADGKVLIGGSFTNGIKRLTSTGAADASFATNVGSTIGTTVYDIEVQSDGKILVAGTFGVKRLNADGTADTSFNSASTAALSGTVNSIGIASDGSIIAGGGFSGGLKRLTSAGAAGTAFTTTPGSTVNAVAIASDGKIVVGGSFSGNLKRYNPDGTLDTYFSVAAGDIATVTAVAVTANNDIIVGTDSTYSLRKYYGSYPMPATPAAPTAAANADGTITVTTGTLAAAASPTPSSYEVSVVGDSTKTCTVTLAASSCLIGGLTVGTSYQFQTTATLGDKTSPASPASTSVTSVDTIAPTYSSAAVSEDGTTLTLTYNEALATTSASSSAFTVVAGGVTIPVSGVAVVGAKVILTLTQVVERGQTVTIAYSAPTAQAGTSNSAVQDVSGNDATSLAVTTATNSSTVDTIAPVVTSVTVGSSGTTITLTYGETLSSTSAPASAFDVTVAGSPATVSAATVSGSTVVLTVSPTINGGQTVFVNYTAPASSSLTTNSAVQDAAGNDALSLTNQSVTNGSSQGPPVITSAVLNSTGTSVILTYSQNLYTSWSNFPSQYAFYADGARVSTSSVSMNGNTLTIGLSPAVTSNRTVTVTYTAPTSDNSAANTTATQNTLGIDALTQTDFPVTNNSTVVGDTTAPTLSSAVLASDGKTLTLTYSENLASTTAAASAFTVTDAGSPMMVNGATVSGSTVVLTLSSPIQAGDAVAVSYVPPATNGGAGNAAVQDSAGNDAGALTNVTVTNNSTAGPDIVAPVYQSMTVGTNTVTLVFNEGISSTTAAASNYTVFIGNTPVTPASLAVSGGSVVLTMASNIPSGSLVTVVYTPPAVSTSTTNAAIQDARGNDATTFTAKSTAGTLTWGPVATNAGASASTAGCSGSFFANSGRTATLPTGVTYTVGVSGDYFCISSATESLSQRGGQAADFTSAGLVTEPGVLLQTSNVNCVSGVPCDNRGTLTITYSQAVTNPVVSFAGWGGGTGSTAAWSKLKLLTPGVTMSKLSGTNLLVSQNGTYVEEAGGIPNVNCHGSSGYGSNANAVCGSLLITGTVTSLTFQVDMENSGGVTGTGIGYLDQWNLTASIPEDLGLVPASYESAGLAGHVTGDLRMGSVVTADQVSSDNNSTFNPAAVLSGVAIPAHEDDGVAAWPTMDVADKGLSYTVPVSLSGVTSTAYLCGWIDFNRDGTFTPGERACATDPVSGATTANITWTIPQDVTNGLTYMRLRLSYEPLPLPTGKVGSGEVEDYSMMITPSPSGPQAAPDATTGPYNTAQTKDLLANDIPTTGSTFDISSVKLCNPTSTPAEMAPTCTIGAGGLLNVPGVGSYSVNASGIITFTPLATFVGTPPALKYQVTDANGQVANSNYTPTVEPPPLPAATNDVSSGAYDVNQTITVLSNDTKGALTASFDVTSVRLCQVDDPATSGTNEAQSPNNCSATSVTIPGEGTYTVNTTTGVVTFDPLPSFAGTVATPVKYQVTDILGRTVNATITPTVTAPPTGVAFNDSIHTAYDTNQTYTPTSNDQPGAVGGNVADIVATSIKLCSAGQVSPNCTATSVTTSEGTYTVNSDGTVTFDPAATFTGTAQLPVYYQVLDELGRSLTAKITPVIDPPTAPTATPDTESVLPGGTVTFTNITGTSSLATGTSLQTTGANKTCLIDPATSQCDTDNVVSITGQGTFTLDPTTGVVTYVADVNATGGTKTAVTYKVTDVVGQTATSTLTPIIPPPPVSTANTSSGVKGVDQVISILANDSPGSVSAPLVATSVKLCQVDDSTTQLVNEAETPNSCSAALVAIPGEGTYEVNPDGTVTFIPLSTFTGTVQTPVTYVVADSLGQKTSATITPSVVAAVNDVSSGAYDTNQTITPLSNDVAVSGHPFSQVKLCSQSPLQTPNNCTATSVTVPGEGTYTVNSDGTVTFDPLPTFTGTVTHPVTYQASDDLGNTVNATITPTVTAPPLPSASNNTSAGAYDTNQSIDVVANDTKGAPSATFDVTSVRLCQVDDPATSGTNEAQSPNNCSATSVTIPGEGAYTVNPTTGVVTFDPLPSFAGTVATPVTYQVTDILGRTVNATITPTVTAPPLPSAANNTSSGAYDTNQLIDVVTNDTKGAPSATFDVTSVKLCQVDDPATSGTNEAQSPNNCTATSVTIPGEGTYTVNTTTGMVTFDPLPSFAGTVATPVKYQVTDILGRTVNATITPTVTAPTAPTATPDTESVLPGGTVTFTNITGTSSLATGTSLQTTGANKTCLIDPATSQCDTDNVVSITGQGTFTLNPATGVVTYVADANATGGTKTAVTYQVTDIVGQKATNTLTPIIPPAPVALNDLSTGAYDTNQVINVLLGDSPGAPSAPLVATTVKLCQVDDPATAGTNEAQSPNNCTATSVTIPGEGTYTVNSDGTVTFDPLPTFTGTATHPVTYVVADTLGQKAAAIITPEVIRPTAPVATPDTESVLPGGTVTFTNITGTSSLATGTSLQTTGANKTCLIDPATSQCDTDNVVSITGQGTFTLDPTTGIVTYVADVNATGGTKTAVTYKVTDVVGQTATSTLTPIIPPPPVATANTSSGVKGATQTIPVLTNDSPGNVSAPLVVTSVKLCASNETPNNCTASSVTIPGEGTYTANSDGTVTFIPLSTFTGTVQTPVTYVVADSLGQKTSATITPSVVAAVNDVSSGAYDTNQTITPLSNDVAVSGHPFSQVKLCSQSPLQTPNNCTATSVTVPGEGTYTVNSDGTVTFDPLPTFTGTVTHPVTYQASDDLGNTVNATITPTVTAPPLPSASNNTSAGAYDTNQSIDVVANDTKGAPSATFDVTSVRLCQVDDPATSGTNEAQSPNNCSATSVTIPGEGAYTVNPTTGVVTFDPLPSFAGTVATPVKYQVTDILGRTVNATITPTVTAPPTGVAFNDSIHTAYDTNQTYTPTSNDQPGAVGGNVADIVATSIKLCSAGQVSPNCTATSVTTSEGTYTVNSDGTVTFDPAATFTGTAQLPVYYQVLDELGRSLTAKITPVIDPPTAPTATPDTESVLPGGTVTFTNITGTSSLATGTSLQTTGANKTCLIDPATSQCDTDNVVSITGQGTFTLDPTTGVVTYVADVNATGGTKTAVTYKVTDVVGQTATSTLTPIIPPAPVAQDDATTGPYNAPQSQTVTTNDTPGTGTSLVASTVRLCQVDNPLTNGTNEDQNAPSCTATTVVAYGANNVIQGTYTVNTTTGVITFTPVDGFVGTATPVDYVVADTLGQKTTAKYTPTVLPPTPPVAHDDSYTTTPMTPITFDVTTNDSPGSFALVATTVRLCQVTDVTPNCTQSSVTDQYGTLTVDPANGQVTFTPTALFTEFTPVNWNYVIADTHGNYTFARITITDPIIIVIAQLVHTGLNILFPAMGAILLIGLGLALQHRRGRKMRHTANFIPMRPLDS